MMFSRKFLFMLFPSMCLFAMAEADTFTVTTEVPTGPGSLAQALADASLNPGPDLINFGPGVEDIGLTQGIFLDDAAAVTLDGGGTVQLFFTGTGQTADGVQMLTGGHTLRAIHFDGFPGDGVEVTASADDVVIENVIVTGTGLRGIAINGDRAIVQGCLIGYDGSTVSPVGTEGIQVADGTDVTIGLDAAGNGAGNTIIGGNNGIRIIRAGRGLLVRGNFVGATEDGMVTGGVSQHGIIAIAPGGVFQENVVVGSGFAGIIASDTDAAGVQIIGNRLEGNGVDPTPTTPKAGIFINGIVSGTVGGNTPAEANICVGNVIGIELRDDCTSVVVAGNRVGVEVDGTTANGNTTHGIVVRGAAGGSIGTVDDTSGNIIAHNGEHGLLFEGGTNQLVLNNRIGVDGAGGAAGNGQDGVLTSGGPSGLVFGSPGDPNTVAFNGGAGLNLGSGFDLLVSGNAIFSNTGAGIVLAQGVNNSVAPPVIGSTEGTVRGTALPNAIVEIFSDAADEGERFLGSTTADENGVFRLTLDLSGETGRNITATTTQGGTETSVFSEALGVNTFGSTALHTADTSVNNTLELGEVLRVVQLYNAGGFACDAGSEDGFAPGSGSTTCGSHSSDYNGGADWQIDLTEMLRLVQLFNAGGYIACPGGGTEDRFCIPAR